MNYNAIAAFATIAALAALPAASFATTTNGQINVSATVSADCSLTVPGSTIALGAVDPLTSTTPSATISSVSVQCNAGTPYTIGLGATAGATPAFATQTFSMANSGHSLNYTASLANYGTTATSSTAVSDALTLAIISGQDAYFGSYSGSFYVTVAY